MENIVHSVTSGEPNTVNAGELFDSGLTALIMPSKSFSHKFIHPGEFSYFCRVHPTMLAKYVWENRNWNVLLYIIANY